jgi:1-aminocyclopropane-1-carboxylate deaminase/D-cysteine desulfhydrase-like pyridoxal-dependent ACC family enzyme
MQPATAPVTDLAARAAALRTRLAQLPRERLAHLPTPLDELPRFSAALGGPRILCKRDDLTGLALGGNKTRQLEYLLGGAREAGAEVVVVGAGAQSNLCRQTAAAAARLGLEAVLVLWGPPESPRQGNLLLDEISDAIDRTAEELRRQGRRPWVVKGSGAGATIAYVAGALELADQLQERGIQANYVYLSAGGATQAGLVLAARHLGLPWHVVGVTPIIWQEGVRRRIAEEANAAAAQLGLAERIEPDDLDNREQYVGPGGYGSVTPEGVAALALLARTEGILLDPVYTAKALAALIDDVRAGTIRRDQTVVFLHTGGLPGLFYHAEEVRQRLP